MSKFASLADFGQHLRRVVIRMPAAKAAALAKGAEIAAERAKSKLGTYQPGWPALKPETVARKAAGDSPLLETGAMRSTITAKGEGPTKANVTAAGPAIFHELGTSKMPPRPFLGPAVRETAPELLAAVSRAVSENLEKR